MPIKPAVLLLSAPTIPLRPIRRHPHSPTSPSPSSDSQNTNILTPHISIELAEKPDSDIDMSMTENSSQPSGSRKHSKSPVRQLFHHSHSENALGDIGGKMMAGRRSSRMDPMGRDDEMDEDEGYGELGHRHPLRRVQEEGGDGSRTRLPGIRSLLDAADHPSNSSSSSNSSSVFTPHSLPPLVPGSPSSSASTLRTSRYSSLNSSISQETPGWWSQERDPTSATSSSNTRHNSFPLVQPFHVDDHDAKRRRSDLPRSTQDAEEAARLRWQAQSRNASFPLSASIGAGPGQSGLRNLLHPPSSAGMSRGSLSGSTILPDRRESQIQMFDRRQSQISPHERRDSQLAFDMRRPVPASRQLSLVGGQLSRAFGDLSANDGSPKRVMPPPLLPLPTDRRTSSLSPRPSTESLLQRTGPRSAPPPQGDRSETFPPRPLGNEDTVDLSSRPGSSEGTVTRTTPPVRSSLTEAIMAKAGDEASYTGSSRRSDPPESRPGSIPLEKASLSEPVPGAASLFWERRGSPDDARGGHNGMEVLAESARRMAEEDARPDDMTLDAEIPGTVVQGPSGPKYSCNYCNKTFSRPSSLRIHTYSHTGERPFVCPEPSCRRRFSVQSNLKRHAKVHQLGNTPFLSNGMPLASGPGRMHPHPGHPGWPPHMMTAPPGMLRGPMQGYPMSGSGSGPGQMLPPLQHSPFHPGPAEQYGGHGRYHPYDHEMLRHPGLPRTKSTPADYEHTRMGLSGPGGPGPMGRRSPRQEMAMRGWQGDEEEEELDEAELDELDEDER